jgi:hypothetical protein
VAETSDTLLAAAVTIYNYLVENALAVLTDWSVLRDYNAYPAYQIYALLPVNGLTDYLTDGSDALLDVAD